MKVGHMCIQDAEAKLPKGLCHIRGGQKTEMSEDSDLQE